MKTRRILLVGVLALVLPAALALRSVAGTEKEVDLSQTPEAVRATIQQHLDGGTVTEIEVGKKDGVEVYEVEVTKDGKEIDLLISSDGTYLGREVEEGDEEGDDEEDEDEAEEVLADLSLVPAAVRESAMKIVGSNPVKKITRETDDGVAEYEIAYEVGGVEHSATLAAGGEILELENKLDPKTLPAAVLAALEKAYPGATVAEADAVQVFYYEVEIVKDGKKQEVKVSASGDIEDEHQDGGHERCEKGKGEKHKEEGHHKKAENDEDEDDD